PALRAPERIERIARADLGMLTPRPQQVAALPITTPTRAIAGPSPSAWHRLAAWFIRSEAAAGEPSQSARVRLPSRGTRRRSNPRRAGRLFRRRPSRPVPGWFQTRADLLTEHRTVIRRRTMVM